MSLLWICPLSLSLIHVYSRAFFLLRYKPQDVSSLSIVLTMVMFFVVVVVSFQESQEKYRCNQPGLTEL